MAVKRKSPTTAALALRERNRDLDNPHDSLWLKETHRSPVPCIEELPPFQDLPEVLLKELLSFFPVDEILVTISLVCKKTRHSIHELLNPNRKCKENWLVAAYETLRAMHKRYMKLRDNHAQKLSTKVILFDIYQSCSKRIDRLVSPDDKELLEALGMDLQRTQAATFAQYRKVLARYQQLLDERRQYMWQFYQGPLGEPKSLSKLGDKVSTQICKHFDEDGDDKLNYEELKRLNDYAGVPLAYETYQLTLRKFESREGALTIAGYKAMFLHNFNVVPDLMYKDLLALEALIDKNATSPNR